MAEEDILYGKNRHLFGGIAPSNMKKFTARMDKTLNAVVIEAELPDDTVVDGHTLCSVAGAKICCRTDRFPVDEFDGEIADVISKKKFEFVFDDTVLENSAERGEIDITEYTYYFSAFPYSTQGVYNRNEANRAVANEPPALNRVILNRHNNDSKLGVLIECYPNSRDIDGITIVRSQDSCPQTEIDGSTVKRLEKGVDFEDSSLNIHVYDYDFLEEGRTYYYAAFPYKNNRGFEVYNYSDINKACIMASSCEYYYGYDLVMDDSDPENRVIYPMNVDNKASGTNYYSPASSEYIEGAVDDYGTPIPDGWIFNYGSWSEAGGFMPRPCMLKYDGTVDHYLDPNDYGKRADGTPSSVEDPYFEGNAMMEWPKIYTKRWVEDGIYHFRCSDKKHDDTWECWCNYDKKGNEIEHFYTSIYPTVGIGGKLRSISGLLFPYTYTWNGDDSNTDTGSGTMKATDMIEHCQKNGEGWYTDVIADRLLIQDLLVMMTKSTNLQEALGYGIVSTNVDRRQKISGDMDTSGLFKGDVDDYISGIKVFGMEHWWGNETCYVAGLCTINGRCKIKITESKKDGSSVTGYNVLGSGYIDLPNVNFTKKSNYYIADMEVTPFGRIPTDKKSVSTTTYECDALYTGSPSSDGCAYMGDKYDGGSEAGPFALDLSISASSAVGYANTRLTYKG